MDSLNFKTFLLMKYYVENKTPTYSWTIKTFGFPFTWFLDDGSQSYFTFQFDEEQDDIEDLERIFKQLAKELNIEYEG